MGAKSSIEWCDATWNVLRGCSRVSEGCRNCYAERTAIRQAGPGRGYAGLVTSTPAGPRWTGDVRFAEDVLDLPLRWKRPRRIFVNSMSDLFHEKVTDEQIARIFAVMQLAQHHTFQVLTKRPERMLRWFEWLASGAGRAAWLKAVVGAPDGGRESWSQAWPFRNIWLGVSVEHQAAADERIPLLLRTPAAVRFLSVEPLLGPVDLRPWLGHKPDGRDCSCGMDGMSRVHAKVAEELQWIIVGGESGPGARPCDLHWIRMIVAHAKAAGVPTFVKQLGAHPQFYSGPNLVNLKLEDPKGGDWSEWTGRFDDLRVREFPR